MVCSTNFPIRPNSGKSVSLQAHAFLSLYNLSMTTTRCWQCPKLIALKNVPAMVNLTLKCENQYMLGSVATGSLLRPITITVCIFHRINGFVSVDTYRPIHPVHLLQRPNKTCKWIEIAFYSTDLTLDTAMLGHRWSWNTATGKSLQ